MADRNNSNSEDEGPRLRKHVASGNTGASAEASAPKSAPSSRREKSGKSANAVKSSGIVGFNIQLPAFVNDSSNPVGWTYQTLKNFFIDSERLIRRCSKPDTREFKKIAYACAIGFCLMGLVGYLVKLVFIPINNIIVGGG